MYSGVDVMSMVSIEDFSKLDLRVGYVIDAERIPGRSKVVKLKVDIGGGEIRTIVAGGGEYYTPEWFKGRLLVVLVNLEPKKIAGVESKGMALAAMMDGKPIWLTTFEPVPPGSKIL